MTTKLTKSQLAAMISERFPRPLTIELDHDSLLDQEAISTLIERGVWALGELEDEWRWSWPEGVMEMRAERVNEVIEEFRAEIVECFELDPKLADGDDDGEIAAHDEVSNWIEDMYCCDVDIDLMPALRNSEVAIGCTLVACDVPADWPDEDNYEDWEPVLDVLQVDPKAFASWWGMESDARWPHMPERFAGYAYVFHKDLAEAVRNMPYSGDLVAMLGPDALERFATREGDEDGNTFGDLLLLKGTELAIHSFGVGATSTFMPLLRHMHITPDEYHLYNDRLARYGICAVYGERQFDGDALPMDEHGIRWYVEHLLFRRRKVSVRISEEDWLDWNLLDTTPAYALCDEADAVFLAFVPEPLRRAVDNMIGEEIQSERRILEGGDVVFTYTLRG